MHDVYIGHNVAYRNVKPYLARSVQWYLARSVQWYLALFEFTRFQRPSTTRMSVTSPTEKSTPIPQATGKDRKTDRLKQFFM